MFPAARLRGLRFVLARLKLCQNGFVADGVSTHFCVIAHPRRRYRWAISCWPSLIFIYSLSDVTTSRNIQ